MAGSLFACAPARLTGPVTAIVRDGGSDQEKVCLLQVGLANSRLIDRWGGGVYRNAWLDEACSGDNGVDTQRILFVCMGNICRSPTAHGVFRDLVAADGLADVMIIDSAATHAYHTGSAPDSRTIAHAARRGYDLSDLRARPVEASDYDWADHILVMDRNNLTHILAGCPSVHRHKVRLLTAFCRDQAADHVPDPYYGGPDVFERVLDIVEDACDGLLEHLKAQSGVSLTGI